MPPTPGSIGPGYRISVSTGYGGSIDPATMFWIVRAQSAANENGGDWSVSIPARQKNDFLNLSSFTQVTNAPSLDAHEDVVLTISLVQADVGDIDTFYSQTGWTWNPTDNLAVVMQTLGGGGGGTGGYTQGDRDAAAAAAATGEETNQFTQAINAATTAIANIGGQILHVPIGQVLSQVNLDSLRIVDLGGGITCERIDADLSSDALWGVVVRITQYPDTTVFRTPDAAWSFSDLAVITFIHSGDIVQRHGIHTTSHTVSPLPAVTLPWPNNFGWPVQPSDYHAVIDWAPGVCGELLGLRLP
jgi:hypothetical protein